MTPTGPAEESTFLRGTQRCRRVVGVVALVLIACGVVLVKWRIANRGVESQVERGLSAIGRGITARDVQAFAEAREAFREAARHSTFDTYPFFLIQLSDDLTQMTPEQAAAFGPQVLDLGPEAATRRGLCLISQGNLQEARQYLELVRQKYPTDKRSEYYLRFLDDLEKVMSRG